VKHCICKESAHAVMIFTGIDSVLLLIACSSEVSVRRYSRMILRSSDKNGREIQCQNQDGRRRTVGPWQVTSTLLCSPLPISIPTHVTQKTGLPEKTGSASRNCGPWGRQAPPNRKRTESVGCALHAIAAAPRVDQSAVAIGPWGNRWINRLAPGPHPPIPSQFCQWKPVSSIYM
jgi:hypothetical protein